MTYADRQTAARDAAADLDTSPAFVTVGGTGFPTGHATAAAAAQKMNLDTWGRFLARDTGAAEIRDTLERVGMDTFSDIRPDSSPRFAAAFANPSGQPLRAYLNRHLSAASFTRRHLARAAAAWGARGGPRVGDYVRHPDGTRSRFTYDWGDGLQAGGGAGSYHIGPSGFASYSGGLSAEIPRDRLTLTPDTDPASFWIWLDGMSGAHRGVTVQLPARIYQETQAQ